MSTPSPSGLTALPADEAEQVDQVCDRFEAAWKAGDRPALAAYLDGASAAVRSALLRELILLDITYRRRAGDHPQPADYASPYPDLDAAWLAGVLSVPASQATGWRRLGKFALLEQVGAGAFGAVWRAHDTELDRIVALKLPHPGLLASPDHRERFVREARAAAQLRHPGIGTVHDVVTADGQPVIVSDFIDGQ